MNDKDQKEQYNQFLTKIKVGVAKLEVDENMLMQNFHLLWESKKKCGISEELERAGERTEIKP